MYGLLAFFFVDVKRTKSLSVSFSRMHTADAVSELIHVVRRQRTQTIALHGTMSAARCLFYPIPASGSTVAG